MDGAECVRVAVNIRPLITSELLVGCTDCISVVPGEPQVQIGTHTFTYDYVYSSSTPPSSSVYDDCVAPLVDALFHGYNATVLAYGQTGSGKTYTMGTNYSGEGGTGGIIPKVMESIFKKVAKMKDSTEFLIRVSFIEIFKEEVFDLIDPTTSKHEGAANMKPVARVPIQIRETVSGGITLAGVTEAEVRTKEEMGSYLARGSLARATGSTNMNSQSSRSHAIFTITMEQKKTYHSQNGAANDEIGDDILCAKLHLVDLAGSERAKRTGADGMRLKEGIHINKGLLALGNVISALGDDKKRREGGHVPYRDSKLTRLLQDSLGGNSKTVMIACVSPADTNAEETLNTLKYANRARNIQNKAVINRDPMAAQLQLMRSQIEQLQTELLFYRGDASLPYEELQILKHKVSLLEASNMELRHELHGRRITCEYLRQRALEAQIEKDELAMKIEAFRNGKSWDEIDSKQVQEYDMLKNYVSKIQELEGELLCVKNSQGSRIVDCVEGNGETNQSKNILFSCNDELSSDYDTNVGEMSDTIEDVEKEQEHSTLQQKLDQELKELDKALEQKEAEMKRFTSSDTSVLKLYEKKVLELEHEKKALQIEIEELRHNLSNISSTSGDGAQKLKEDYLHKLNLLEGQVSELKKKQDAQAQVLRQKQKSEEAARRLQDEIQKIKTQKVQLQHKIKQESEQFRLWKASREKEVLQLKKEGRRNEYEMHKLLALNQRQKMVLQRKTEEANAATKKLKELLESRKSSRETSGHNAHGIQSLMQAIELELEVTVKTHEVRSEYERQMEERSKMAKERNKLIEDQRNLMDSSGIMSPGARNSRIFALDNMLATSSSTMVSMASQLSEAEERERGLIGRGRWNQVRSLPDAKTLMNHLFNLASSSRCMLRDKEVVCKEKDLEIRELKEKVVSLNGSLRKLEIKNAELMHQNSALKKSENGHKYDLRKLDSRTSFILEDMDISNSDDEWIASEKPKTKKRKSKYGNLSDIVNSGGFKLDSAGEGIVSVVKKIEPGGVNLDSAGEGIVGIVKKRELAVCCTCSKISSCKTTKCQCRSSGGSCGESCGCVSTKCSNRGSGLFEAYGSDWTPEGETVLGIGSDEEKNQLLASQGAKLLENALVERSSGATDGGGPRRKALSEIGNSLAKSNAPKPMQRKKWRKSTLQLVPTALPPTQPATAETPQRVDEGAPVPIPMKLPRAMRSAAASNGGNPFRERNSDKPDQSEVNNKEAAGVPAPRSPLPQNKTSDEKENRGL